MTAITNESAIPRRAACIAGITLILMAIAAGIAYGWIHTSLVADGDAAATWENIRSSLSLFQIEILSWLVILICDIVVTWAFYILMRSWNKNLALLAALLRLIYTALLGTALLNLVYVLLLTNGTIPEAAASADQVLLYLKAFEYLWFLGLIVFGGHLMVISYIAYRSGRVPKILSLLLLLASIGYILIHLGHVVLPPDNGIVPVLEWIFNLPMIAGELGFGIWLLLYPLLNPAK
jgi:hypothetical protein